MVKSEHLTTEDGEFTRTFSDAGYYIHGGEPEDDYAEAIDPADIKRSYVETNRLIEADKQTVDYATAYIILTGGNHGNY